MIDCGRGYCVNCEMLILNLELFKGISLNYEFPLRETTKKKERTNASLFDKMLSKRYH